MRGDQLDAALGQLRAQGVAVVTAVGNHARWLVPGTTRAVPSSYPDRLERRLR
jgi:hypothetical protein